MSARTAPDDIRVGRATVVVKKGRGPSEPEWVLPGGQVTHIRAVARAHAEKMNKAMGGPACQ